MKLKHARILRDTLVIGGFLIFILGGFSKTVQFIGVCISASSLIPQFLFYKCPYCGRLLGIGGFDTGGICRRCGKHIED